METKNHLKKGGSPKFLRKFGFVLLALIFSAVCSTAVKAQEIAFKANDGEQALFTLATAYTTNIVAYTYSGKIYYTELGNAVQRNDYTEYRGNGYVVQYYSNGNYIKITSPSQQTFTFYYDDAETRKLRGESPMPSSTPSYQGTPSSGSNQIKCNTCNGSGVCRSCSGTGGSVCSYCNGNGKKVYGYGTNQSYETCVSCKGTGKNSCAICKGNGRCNQCNGKGHINY